MSDTPSLLQAPVLQPAPRVSRLRLLVAVVLLFTVAGIFVVRHLEGRARQEIFGDFLAAQGQDCHRAVEDFYRPISNLLQLIPQWGASKIVQFDEPDRIQDHFVPLLSAQPGAVALTIVGHGGRSYDLRREGETWKGELFEPEQYDRRESQWYDLATRRDMLERLMFTELPVPLTVDEPHLLAALAWNYEQEGQQRTGAAALEMTGEVTRELRERLSISKGSIVMILGQGDVVTWLTPGEERHFDAVSLSELTRSEEQIPQLLARSLISWGEIGRAYEENFPVRREEGEYWCRFLELDGGEAARSMALLVPRSDLNERLSVLTRPFLYALLGLVVLALVIIAVLYQQYRRRLTELRDRGAHTRLNEGGLRGLIDQGESDRLEFKSTLRWNLKANKPGKEIEMAWLKTLVAYLNTEGGTLLVGVADDGSIVGMEPDGFRNEDKYLLHFNNCVKQHIGIEFARFLSFDLRPIEGQQIFVVDARPADDPAFLVLEDEEEFYVRLGPASRKVSPRKALEYLKERS